MSLKLLKTIRCWLVAGDVFYTRKGARAHAEEIHTTVKPVAIVNTVDPQALVDQVAEAITRYNGEFEMDRYHRHARTALVALGIITEEQARKVKQTYRIISYT